MPALPTLRPMIRDDVEDAVRLTAAEGWATHRRWFQAILEHDPEGSLVAVRGRRIVGLVTATRYAASAWLGNLVVAPEERHRGLGSRLLAAAVEELEAGGSSSLRLEADPLGISLYRRLGFEDELESLRFRLAGDTGDRGTVAVDAARPLARGDLAAVAAFDRPLFGDDRERMLALLHGLAEASCVVRRDGEVAGYAMALPSEDGLRLGPWVASDAAAAEALLDALLETRRGREVTVGVPETTPRAVQLLEHRGFVATDSSHRMRRGPDVEAPVRGHVYGIAHSAIG